MDETVDLVAGLRIDAANEVDDGAVAGERVVEVRAGILPGPGVAGSLGTDWDAGKISFTSWKLPS